MSEPHFIHSPWLGDIEFEPGCELRFPHGLPGFEAEQTLLAVEIPAQRPMIYLQSVQNAALCFVTLPVAVIDQKFQITLSDEEKSTILFPEDRDPIVGVDVICVALLSTANHRVHANLGAPVVINLHNSLGVQCISTSTDSRLRWLNEAGTWEAEC